MFWGEPMNGLFFLFIIWKYPNELNVWYELVFTNYMKIYFK